MSVKLRDPLTVLQTKEVRLSLIGPFQSLKQLTEQPDVHSYDGLRNAALDRLDPTPK
ncbi:hypothetical protein GF395_00665 [Candidatus Uhrbacteria bacterium]|nr:hypothetical protein [Candidatus Uhrbacteria bacterium]